MSNRVRIVLIVSGVSLLAGPARGALLNLPYAAPPDITAGFIDVFYNAGLQQFVADGFAQQLDDGTPPPKSILTPGYNFHIDATVDNLGNLTPGGSFSVTGLVTVGPTTYGTSGPLLTGVVSAFGYGDQPINYDLNEFLITLTGGELAIPLFYGVPGTQIGIDFDGNYGGAFSGSFANSFDNTGGFGAGFGTGQADIKPIPEPATLVLAVAGAAALFRRRNQAS